MNESDMFNKGFDNRKEMLGDAHVECAWANEDAFNRPVQRLVTEFFWGTRMG